MKTCRGVPRTFSLLSPICKTIGREVVLTRVGILKVHKPGDDIQWCSDCGRYYNPSSPHECNMKKVNQERRSLEQFLGKYRIKGETE